MHAAGDARRNPDRLRADWTALPAAGARRRHHPRGHAADRRAGAQHRVFNARTNALTTRCDGPRGMLASASHLGFPQHRRGAPATSMQRMCRYRTLAACAQPARVARARALLVLFALIWLQITLGGHHTPSIATMRLGDTGAIEALIAGAWCGTTAAPASPSSPGEDGTGHGTSACLHCATSCHASGARQLAWLSLLPWITLIRSSARAQSPWAAAPEWSSANRTRGPPHESMAL